MWKVHFAHLDGIVEIILNLSALQHAEASAVWLQQRKQKIVSEKAAKISDQFQSQSLI